MAKDGTARLRLRVVFGDAGMLGPGKADLLAGIDRTGSIAAAARDMGMSYRRAWALVETLNAIFCEPLVIRSRGGAAGGGASLTDVGVAVLASYRSLEAKALEAGQDDIAAIQARLADMSARS